MAELRRLQRGSPSLGLGCFRNPDGDQAPGDWNAQRQGAHSRELETGLHPAHRAPKAIQVWGLHHAQGSPRVMLAQTGLPTLCVNSPGPWGPHQAPAGSRAGPTLFHWDTSSRHWLLWGEFISWSEKEKQGRVPVFQPGPDQRGEGWHRGQLRLCMLGPTGVLAGSGEGLPGMVAPSLGAEVAGQRAQRTAHMEAINTDRPGTPLQAGGPRWDK